MKKFVLWGAAVAAMLPGMVMACGFEMPPSYYTQEVGKEDESNFSLSPDHLGELKLIGDFYFPAWKNRELMGNSVKSDEAHRIDFFAAGEKLSRPREEVKAAWKKYQEFARACDSVIREHPLLTERSSKDIPADAGIYREFYLYTLGRMQYCILPSRELPPAWKELMALPPASRHYRTVWVKFMELMAQEEYEAIDRVLAEFRQVLDSGFADTAALEESAVRQLCRRDKDLRYLPLALTALDPDNPHYNSICNDYFVYEKQCRYRNAKISHLVNDPVGREILVVMNPEFLARFPILPNEKGAILVADRQAWRAFFQGDFVLARQLLNLAPERSLLRLYLEGKFARIEKRYDDAVHDFRQFLEEYRKRGKIPEGFLCTIAEMPEQVAGELGTVYVSRRDFQEALLCFLEGKSWIDAAVVAEWILTEQELAEVVDAHPNTNFQAELRWLLARRLMRNYQVERALPYFDADMQVHCRNYIDWSRKANDRNIQPRERALALYALGRLMLAKGMELFGTELKPDNKIYDGEDDSDISWSWGDGIMNQPQYRERFHYRLRAAAFFMRAVQLSTDTDCKVASLWFAWKALQRKGTLMQNGYFQALCDLRPHRAAEQAAQLGWIPSAVQEALRTLAKETAEPSLEEIRKMVADLVAASEKNLPPEKNLQPEKP
ncbi:MAG: hypothetical protein J6R85_04005 [Lentisphaeria bacterium]|nr:hypothetical protein [Lentisphaeria bacterium]